MKWLVFTYSLPSKLSNSSRVRIWRKLRKAGAICPKAGVYVLPYNDECIEAVRWLATEVEQEQGEALVMQVDHFENLPHDKVIDMFRQERMEDYKEIEKFLQELEELIKAAKENDQENVLAFKRDINKLKKTIDEVARVDFFPIETRRLLLDRLHNLRHTFITGNLILSILVSIGSMNGVVLRKMKEEYLNSGRRHVVKTKCVKEKSANISNA